MRERWKEVSETGTVDLFRILVLIHRTIIAAELDRCGMVKHKEHTDPVWSEITLDMVLTCFDDAVRDYNAERQKKPQKGGQRKDD